MKKMTERQLAKWEKTRDLGQEILQGIQDLKAGRIGRRFTAATYPIVRARENSRCWINHEKEDSKSVALRSLYQQ